MEVLHHGVQVLIRLLDKDSQLQEVVELLAELGTCLFKHSNKLERLVHVALGEETLRALRTVLLQVSCDMRYYILLLETLRPAFHYSFSLQPFKKCFANFGGPNQL